MAASKPEVDTDQHSIEAAQQLKQVTDNSQRDDDDISVRSTARGDDLPSGYFRSWQFIGMVFVSTPESG